MLIWLGLSSANRISEKTLNAVIERAASRLPPLYTTTPCLSYKHPSGCTFVYAWRPSISSLKDYIAEDGASLVLVSGYLSAIPPGEEERLLRSIDRAGNFPDFHIPVGGIYSMLHLRKSTGQLSAVQSKSGLEAVFERRKNMLCSISNRPDIAQIALSSSGSVRVSEKLALRLFNSLFLIDGTTHFADTFRVNKNLKIALEKGNLRSAVRNAPEHSVEISDNLETQTQIFMDILQRTIRPYKWTGSPILRVSGGRDSRLLLALFKSNNIKCIIENHNNPQHIEGIIADMVIEKVGYTESTIRNYSRMLGCSVEEAVKLGSRLRGGGPHSVPLHYPFEMDYRPKEWQAITLGHAHHMRGGFAKNMIKGRDTVLELLYRQFSSPFIKKKYHINKEIIDNLIEDIIPIHDLHYMYHFYDELRVPNYLNIHFMEYTSYALPIYPLLDEEIISFANRLLGSGQAFNMISERLFFKATQQFEPRVCEVPLFNKRYRFESHEALDELGFRENYDKRDPQSVISQQESRNNASAFGGFDVSVLDYQRADNEVLNRLFTSPRWKEWKEYLKPETIVEINSRFRKTHDKIRKITLREFCYCMFGLDVLLES